MSVELGLIISLLNAVCS